jgi:hypothetical protein
MRLSWRLACSLMSLCRPYTNPDPAACPLNRLARRTYTVTVRTSRCRVTSMMRVSSTLRSAAVVTKPARKLWPLNACGSSPAAVAYRFTMLAMERSVRRALRTVPARHRPEHRALSDPGCAQPRAHGLNRPQVSPVRYRDFRACQARRAPADSERARGAQRPAFSRSLRHLRTRQSVCSISRSIDAGRKGDRPAGNVRADLNTAGLLGS